nr:immunoglobulin heavy chain junction region [Macaca mulatta]
CATRRPTPFWSGYSIDFW